jgi:methionyl-tRNA synthetase
MKPFYITTTLPYVNAPLHLGHATEIIRADAIARYKKLQGFDVFFNTGTDEHGMKIFEAAQKAGKSTKEYTDYYAALYKETLKKFGISDDVHYIRTTDEHHVAAAQEFWRRCHVNGFIYKKQYQSKYCVGCEVNKTDSELVDGRCPIHPDRELETIEEENYFFKYSAFREKLLELYESNPKLIIPDFRFNEVKEFVREGLHDFSISRLKEKVSWGVPVPGDEAHVMYVWFDALVNYISTLGWPNNMEQFEKFWQDGAPTQYCGKDNTRFQAAMWQAMLMSVDLPPTHCVVVNGFILGGDGIKMSKSLGNVIDPLEIVEEYGVDALRYFVLREFSSFEDSAVSRDTLKVVYNANLANGIGNLTSRIMKMAETNLPEKISVEQVEFPQEFTAALDAFEISKAADIVWKEISSLDLLIQETAPFKLIKEDKEKAIGIISDLVLGLWRVASMIEPLLPETSRKIKECVKENKVPSEPLFLRK